MEWQYGGIIWPKIFNLKKSVPLAVPASDLFHGSTLRQTSMAGGRACRPAHRQAAAPAGGDSGEVIVLLVDVEIGCSRRNNLGLFYSFLKSSEFDLYWCHELSKWIEVKDLHDCMVRKGMGKFQVTCSDCLAESNFERFSATWKSTSTQLASSSWNRHAKMASAVRLKIAGCRSKGFAELTWFQGGQAILIGRVYWDILLDISQSMLDRDAACVECLIYMGSK